MRRSMSSTSMLLLLLVNTQPSAAHKACFPPMFDSSGTISTNLSALGALPTVIPTMSTLWIALYSIMTLREITSVLHLGDGCRSP